MRFYAFIRDVFWLVWGFLMVVLFLVGAGLIVLTYKVGGWRHRIAMNHALFHTLRETIEKEF